MFTRKASLALVAVLVAVLTSSAFARPWHRSSRHPVTQHRVYTSYPIYDRDVARYNDRNVYKNNRSSYSRYPSRTSYRSYPIYSTNRSYRGDSYYRDGYYSRDRYYRDGPSLRIGPVRIDL